MLVSSPLILHRMVTVLLIKQYQVGLVRVYSKYSSSKFVFHHLSLFVPNYWFDMLRLYFSSSIKVNYAAAIGFSFATLAVAFWFGFPYIWCKYSLCCHVLPNKYRDVSRPISIHYSTKGLLPVIYSSWTCGELISFIPGILNAK